MRLLTIGIDGGTFKILRPLMDLGVMPRLRSVMNSGCYTVARSVVPTNSAAAWSSIMTGLNPGKHGVFYFSYLERTEAGPRWGRVINFHSIHGVTVWRVLGDFGLRVCIINVPITYPPEEVNGILISGLLAPSESSDFTFPKELKERLKGYRIDVNLMDEVRANRHDWYDHILTEVKDVTIRRNQNVLSLMRTEKWDFAMVVFRETDDVQHFMWEVISQGLLGNRDSPNFKKVCEYYSILDSSMGQLIDEMGNNSNTIIISDHGFDAMPKRLFDLDAWARSRGLQFLKSDSALMRIALTGLLRKLMADERLSKLVEMVTEHHSISDPLEFGVVKRKDNLIDWSRASAFKLGDGLAINRLEDGKVQELFNSVRRSLTGLVDPETGVNPIADVMPRENLYSGPYASSAADLIVIPSPQYKLSTIPGLKIFEKNTIISLTGEHDRDGIFIASGPNFRQLGQIPAISILDFFPTILALFGIESPETVDGKALNSILIEPKDCKKPAKKIDNTISSAPKEEQLGGFTASEEEEIRNRLSQLGYL